MKIVCEKSNLLKSLNISMKAIPSKTTLPIMECVFIQADDDSITFSSNDGEVSIETVVSGMTEKRGSIAVEAKILLDIIKKMPEGPIEIKSDENCVIYIDSGRAHFSIAGREGDDFSVIPQVPKNNYVSLSQFSFKEIVRQTIFSVDETNSNPMMGGEFLEVEDNILRLSSLDLFRMSIRKLTLKESYGQKKAVIPAKTLNDVCRIIDGGADEEILIFFSKNYVMFEFDDTVVVARVIEGEYFKVNSIISRDYETKVTVNKSELLGSIERSQLLLKESDKKPMIMNFKDNELGILLKSNLGTLKEEIDTVKEGKDIMIGFYPPYVADILRSIDEDEVTFYLQNSKRPGYVTDENDTYFYFILPLNFTI